MSRRKQRHPPPARVTAYAAPARPPLPSEARTLIANATNDITIPFFSGALQHVDDTLIQQGGGKGLAIYDEIERDTHAFALLQKRRKACTFRAWEVEPGGDQPIDKEAADLVKEYLEALPFDRICEDLLDATLKGFAVSEVIWERDRARNLERIKPVRIVAHNQRRFVFDQDWNLRLLTWTSMTDGILLPERKFVVHRVGVKGNNPYGLGLGTRLFWPVLFKREGITFWLHFLEKYAGPTVVGKTPYGMLSDEQRNLLNTLVSIRTSSAVTVPIGTDVEFLEASRSGSVTYEEFIAYWDNQISICTTGETLTTQVGEGGGNRALGEVHQEQLDILADSDGDGLTDTLREQLVRWIVEYNLPGAAVPAVWRVRPKNEMAEAKTREAKATSAEAVDRAITAIVKQAARFDDDQVAREYIVSFDITDRLSDKTIDALVAARQAFTDTEEPDDVVTADPAMFSAARLKKKTLTHRHVCFAEKGGAVERIVDEAVAAAEQHFDRRLMAMRKAVEASGDLKSLVGLGPSALAELVNLAAAWTPDPLAGILGQALEVAAWEGREAVFRDDDDGASFAVEGVRQAFREQIAFLRQKRVKPTKAWTDAMFGDHNRAIVVAGVTDAAMLEEFQAAILEAAQDGQTVEQFGKEFDRLAAKYGWDYRGERNWRVRTIFETNIRTSFMAGRLRQMRDPDVVKLRPYWQYIHGDSRTPAVPRKLHLDWHGLVLMWDDPWWDTHFPPNDWLCSCGVRSLSKRDLARLGKEGPDAAPRDALLPVIDKSTGQMVMKPQGIGLGWDYMPGDHWERGLVPSALIDEADGQMSGGRHLVEIDTPEPLPELMSRARPFTAGLLPEGLPDEDYVRAFLEPFGVSIGKGQLWTDAAGGRITISDLLFRARDGTLKIGKGGRKQYTAMLAETIRDPDEIWLGLRAVQLPQFGDYEDILLTRRYVRVDPVTGLFVSFDLGRRWWEPVTGFRPTRDYSKTGGKTNWNFIAGQRGGKLLWKRK